MGVPPRRVGSVYLPRAGTVRAGQQVGWFRFQANGLWRATTTVWPARRVACATLSANAVPGRQPARGRRRRHRRTPRARRSGVAGSPATCVRVGTRSVAILTGSSPLIRITRGPRSSASIVTMAASPGRSQLEMASSGSGTRTDEARTNTRDPPRHPRGGHLRQVRHQSRCPDRRVDAAARRLGQDPVPIREAHNDAYERISMSRTPVLNSGTEDRGFIPTAAFVGAGVPHGFGDRAV